MPAIETARCAAVAAAGWSLLAALREGLFYAGVAALWLAIIQWDLMDYWLGGPGTPRLLSP